MEIQYYVLFKDHTTGIELYNLLRKEGIRAMMAPTPRSLSLCCGISLLVKEEDLQSIRILIEKNEVEIVDIATVE